MSRHVLTAVAWPYANGPRHIGHVAGFGVPSDVFSRYHRMAGDDVLMVSGTDEHGTPILVQADREGLTPREAADKYNRQIVGDLHGLGLAYDLFTRTTTRNHYSVVQDLFLALHKSGYIVERPQLSAISPSTGRTLPDRYIEGTCPICGYDGARGDQCDSCGNQLDPQDLKNPRSRINGEVPKFVESAQLFLELPAFAERLGSWLQARTDWRPNVLKFSMNLLEDLKPRAISRDLDWGVPIPLPGWSDNPAKKLYVWFDAVIGYLSASVEWARRSGDPDAWRAWWQNDDARGYYFMGKDNVVFHTVIWPSILLGSTDAYGPVALPDEVVSSEFLTMEGRKFSSSRSVVILVQDVLERYGADPLRYYLSVAGPETNDTDFTWEQFVTRNNTELVAGWGNLVNRTLSMVSKNLGAIPAPGELNDGDRALLDAGRAAFGTVGALLERSQQKAAVTETMRVVGEANKYLSDNAPWKLRESDPARFETVLHCALQLVSDCNALLTPVLPAAADRVHAMLGGTGEWAGQPSLVDVDDLDGGPSYPVLTGMYTEAQARWASSPIAVGTPIAPPEPLFRKLDPSVVDEELARLEAGE
ncbi:MAG TPA: methionine--tRNA ligase [Frankiaceae bacterium]|jgi:methionyl-tRNA synthetase|nr:methionine--tRNA ligase [Frankiaceae bacterium]